MQCRDVLRLYSQNSAIDSFRLLNLHGLMQTKSCIESFFDCGHGSESLPVFWVCGDKSKARLFEKAGLLCVDIFLLPAGLAHDFPDRLSPLHADQLVIETAEEVA